MDKRKCQKALYTIVSLASLLGSPSQLGNDVLQAWRVIQTKNIESLSPLSSSEGRENKAPITFVLPTRTTRPVEPVSVQTGVASWFGGENRRMATGERFDASSLTAAHRRLPLGTYVRVTNLANSRTVVLRINDRGPYIRGRMLDVSPAAARRLAMVQAGTARVRMEVLPSAPPVAEM